MVSKNRIAVLAGMTGVGKTDFAFSWAAKRQDIEIISCDSIAVYRELDIGSAKPSLAMRQAIPHHLIDVLDPSEGFSAATFLKLVEATLQSIETRGKKALLVGGTGFYLKILQKGVWSIPPELQQKSKTIEVELEKDSTPTLWKRFQNDPTSQRFKIHPNDRYRLLRALSLIEAERSFSSKLQLHLDRSPIADRLDIFVLDRNPEELEHRIRTRTHQLLEAGWVEEVKSILKKYGEVRALGASGYKQIVQYVLGRPTPGRKPMQTFQDLNEEIVLSHKGLIKKQRTWFRGQKAPFFILDRDRDALQSTLNTLYDS